MAQYNTLICRLEYTDAFNDSKFRDDIRDIFAKYYRPNPKGIWSYGLKFDIFDHINDSDNHFMEIWMRDLYGKKSPERLQKTIEDLLSKTKSVVYLSFSDGF